METNLLLKVIVKKRFKQGVLCTPCLNLISTKNNLIE